MNWNWGYCFLSDSKLGSGSHLFLWCCRKDSFITHRAFCDALAVESAKSHTPPAPVPAPAPAPAAPPPAPASAMINSKIAEEEPKLKIDVAVTSSSPSSSSTSSSSSGVVSTALPVQQQGNGD